MSRVSLLLLIASFALVLDQSDGVRGLFSSCDCGYPCPEGCYQDSQWVPIGWSGRGYCQCRCTCLQNNNPGNNRPFPSSPPPPHQHRKPQPPKENPPSHHQPKPQSPNKKNPPSQQQPNPRNPPQNPGSSRPTNPPNNPWLPPADTYEECQRASETSFRCLLPIIGAILNPQAGLTEECCNAIKLVENYCIPESVIPDINYVLDPSIKERCGIR